MKQDITKEKLQDLANKLLIELSEKEEEGVHEEFKTVLKQMDLIEKIEGIEQIEPMTFPFPIPVELREDEVLEKRKHEEILSNCDDVLNNEIKVPKVVGE